MQFLADLGERPEGMTLDRLDVNGHYEASNCQWATVSDQNRGGHRQPGGYYLLEEESERMYLESIGELDESSGGGAYRVAPKWPELVVVEAILDTPDADEIPF